MFGYVKAAKSQLRICEFEAYKSIYCGLCKDMGKRFGLWARFTLNYDFTFLALLATAVSDSEPAICSERCMFNPFKKSNCCQNNHALTYAGDVAMLMLWHKLEDNANDGGFFEKMASQLGMLFTKPAYNKASKNQPKIAEIMKSFITEQAALEREKCPDTDKICHPTANMLGVVMKELTKDSVQQQVLYQLGYFLGRYVYLCDALDDLEHDEKSGNYNVLLLRERFICDDLNETIREQAKGSLFMTIAEAGKAYDLLTVYRFQPIIENILFLGLRENAEYITISRDNRKKQRKF